MSRNTIILISAASCVLIALIIKSGFKTYKHTDYSIMQTGSAYIVANYSEYECVPDLIDGGLDCGYDYWSENVSDVWQFEFIHGQNYANSNIPKDNIRKFGNKYEIIGLPNIYNHSKRDLDNYSKNKSYGYRLYIEKNKWHHINYADYMKAVNSYDKGDAIIVEYWFFILLEIKYESEVER